MTSGRGTRGGVAALALVGLVAVAGCGGPAPLAASGTVDDPAYAVVAPRLVAPAVNLDAGFDATATAAPAPTGYAAADRVARVAVAQGDRVRAGQPLVALDAAALDAALRAARADQAVAAARPGVLTAALDDLADKRADLVAKRRDVRTAIDTMVAKRAQVIAARRTIAAKRRQVDAAIAKLAAQRAGVAASVANLRAQVDALAAQIGQLTDPAQIAAAQAQLAALRAGLAQAEAGLAKLDAGLSQASAARRKLAAAAAQATAGLAKLDRGLATARSGLAKLDDGLAKLDDGAARLRDARVLARLGASAAAVAVARAEEARSAAKVVAPADGVIVAIVRVGDVVAPGATLVTLRPDQAATVTTWLSPEQADGACAGASAAVVTDWGVSYAARVERVGVRAEYPPTALATSEVHLTRALAVTVALDDAAARPPAGVGVDVRISPCPEQK